MSVFRASDGAFLRAFGSPGDREGQLDCPRGVAASTAGEVFVVDSGNQRVCVFRGSDGAFLRALGVPHEHGWPEDVALTAAGELLVTCGFTHPQCFVYRAADGAWLRTFPAVPAGYGSAGVAVGARGEVVVACHGRVHVFE